MPAAFCATGPFNSAFALGAGSNATTDGDFLFVPGSFDTAIAVGTNDVVTAGAFVSTGPTPFPVGSPAASTPPLSWALAAPPSPALLTLLPAITTSPPSSTTCSARLLPAPTAWSTS